MSTRCNVEIYDHYEGSKPVILYHHSDGYPSCQIPKLHAFLKNAYARLKKLGYPYWWDSERVAAMLILLSADSYTEPTLLTEERFAERAGDGWKHDAAQGYPVYQPCASLHGDIEYIYRVKLGGGSGNFTIEVYDTACKRNGETKAGDLLGSHNSTEDPEQSVAKLDKEEVGG